MSQAISLLVDGKQITIMFDDLETAIKVAQTLEKTFDVEPVEGQPDIYREGAEQLLTYLLAEPLYTDIEITEPDYRLNFPTHLLCRSLIGAEQVPIQEFHSLTKQIRQPMQFEMPAEAVPPMPLYPPPVLPVACVQPQPPPEFPLFQLPHQDEQLYKPIQTLFLLCQKNEYYMRDLSNFVKIPFAFDKDTQLRICSVCANKLFDLPIADRISMLKRIPFEGELKEKVLEILYKEKADQDKKEREREKQANERHRRTQQPILQQNQLPDSEKIKQVMSVLKQLQPEAISKLLHGEQPAQLALEREQGYKMSFKPGFKAQCAEQYNISQMTAEYELEMQEAKAELAAAVTKSEDIVQHVKQLFQKYSERHDAIFRASEMYRFHESFTVQENLLIALRVRAQEPRRTQQYSMKRLAEEAQERLSINIFEKLKIIVEQHKNVEPPAVNTAEAATGALQKPQAQNQTPSAIEPLQTQFGAQGSLSEPVFEAPAHATHSGLSGISGASVQSTQLIESVEPGQLGQGSELGEVGELNEPSELGQPSELSQSGHSGQPGQSIQPPPPTTQFPPSAPPAPPAPPLSQTVSSPLPQPLQQQLFQPGAANSAPAPASVVTGPGFPAPQSNMPAPQSKERPRPARGLSALNTQNLTPQHQQILQDVQKAQDALRPPDVADVHDVARNFKASVTSKIFVTILGLGYQYHHLYLLEQNLLEKQVETLREQLNFDISTKQMEFLTDVLLKSLIVYIIEKESAQELPPFTSKQKPQMVKIAPQMQAMYEVKDFFFKYQEICSELRGEKDAGKPFPELNEMCEFVVFQRNDLITMFQGVNIFGDLIEAICVGDK